MVRLRLSASRSVRASARRVRCACGCVRCAVRRHARRRPRLRPALRAAAAAVALSLRRRGGGRAVVRRVRPVRAPRAGTRAPAPKSTCSPRRSGALIGHPAVVLALRLAVLGLFVVTVLAGLFGDQNPYRNIAPTLVWIIWWVGLAYVAAFVGDIWALVNPWRTVFDGAQWLYRRLGGRGELGGRPALPAKRSASGRPACCCSPSPGSSSSIPTRPSPAHIAWLAIAYSVAHLGRHARVRPRRLAAARRGVLAGVRHLRPLRADRGAGTAGCCCGHSARGLLDEPARSRRR